MVGSEYTGSCRREPIATIRTHILRTFVKVASSTKPPTPPLRHRERGRTYPSRQHWPAIHALEWLKSMELQETKTLYEHPANCLIATLQKEHIEKLDQSILALEKAVLGSARDLPCYDKLGTLPGVGRVFRYLGASMFDVGRFIPAVAPLPSLPHTGRG